MQDRADAHHTRFERHVKRCIDQSVIAQGITGHPQRNNFRMRGWITSLNGAIPAFRDQRLVANNNRTHRHFTQGFGLVRQTNGMLHPLFIKPWHESSCSWFRSLGSKKGQSAFETGQWHIPPETAIR
jgi:hypothetical protein